MIEDKGADSVTVDTAEGAHTALCGAVRLAYNHLGPDALATALGPVYGLRLAMVTDGRTAVERGDEWSTTVGGILVRLSP
ncbi:hypothetical protein HOS59_gp56 [Streptomyces phage Rowa]|uniref:Uncharacterized protein n=1 Tax=Streptomyces phage Rowa TaxID=2059883 RepID=A0A2H5BLW2_9CAUD|nr:hypothetical protein HOS59_gp56 [Streptomyces phage Rowa]AUG87320.1 hypothetical protein SEA_ROWA_56 [Streptomyces phage Rowa]